MSPIRGLPQMPSDAGLAKSPTAKGDDGAGFGALMDEVTTPAPKRAGGDSFDGKQQADRDVERPRLRQRFLAAKTDEHESDERSQKGRKTEGKVGVEVEAKTDAADGTTLIAPEVQPTAVPAIAVDPVTVATPDQKNPPVVQPLKLIQSGNDQPEAVEAQLPAATQVAPQESDDDAIALRIVGKGAPLQVPPVAPQASAPPAKQAAPVRTVTATVVAMETHVAPPAPAPSTPRITVADAVTEEDETPVPPDGKANSRTAFREGGRVASIEAARPASGSTKKDVGAETGSNEQGRAPPTAVAGSPPTAAGALPPPAPLANSIANAVKDALAAAPVAATTPPNSAATPALPVQAMTVRLDLPEHGRIDVRVAARGNEVSLHLSAEREETVRKLAREHDAVVASLRDAGYDADIRAIAALRTADARGEPQSSPNGGASPSQSGKDDSSSNPQHSHQGEDRPRPSDRQPHANNRTDTRGAGGIYV